jgi:hypothetical protein
MNNSAEQIKDLKARCKLQAKVDFIKINNNHDNLNFLMQLMLIMSISVTYAKSRAISEL